MSAQNFASQLLSLDTNYVVVALGTLSALFIAHRVGLILHRIWLDPLAKFPGPKLLAASNLPLRLHSDFTGQWVYHVAALHRQYGPVVRIGPKHLSYDGSIGWEAFARPKPGQPEFSKHFAYHHGNEESIVGASREIHRRQRRQLGHAFSEAAMSEQETTIIGYIDMFIKLLDKHAKTQEPFDIVKCLNFTTFDIIGDLSFGESFNGLTSNELHPWVEAIAGNFRGGCMMRFGLYYPLLMPLVTFLLDISGINSVKDRDETRRLGVEKGLKRLEMGELLPNGQRDFMSYMLRKGQQGTAMSNEECLANSIILVIAGSETTATLLSGLFFYQGMNPDVHATLKKEIREAFADESEINMKSVAQLPYLQACIEESLRVYPPAAETPARVSPGAELGGEYVPSGTVISVYQYSSYRNPNNFRDPDSYRPERWLPASHPLYDPKYADDNRSVMKPFSYGPRDCIGKNLAYSEMRLMVARALYRFDVDLAPGQEEWHSSQNAYMVWDKAPLNITLKPRSLAGQAVSSS